MEYIAIKGRPAGGNDSYIIYFCGTYCVTVWTRGIAFLMLKVIEQGGFCKKNALLLSLLRLQLTKKWFRKLKYKDTPKEIIKKMKEAGLIFYGCGETKSQAIRQILDQSAFIPTVRDGTADADIVKEAPDYYKALLQKNLLTELEQDVLSWITSKDAILRKHSRKTIYNTEVAEKFYCTMKTLRDSACFASHSMDELYAAVASLYQKHCIVLTDRIPKVKEERELETDDIHSYLIFA